MLEGFGGIREGVWSCQYMRNPLREKGFASSLHTFSVDRRDGDSSNTSPHRALALSTRSRGCDHGAGATLIGADHADGPSTLDALTRTHHVCLARFPVVNVVALAPTVPDPATVAKVSDVLHWIV